MARKGQVSIQDTIETNEEFKDYLATHHHKLICMEVYSEFCGPCLAMAFAIRKAKLEIGQDQVTMAKAMADKIDALIRFKQKSEPVFLFISKGKLTRAMFGPNAIEFCKIIEEELGLLVKEETSGIQRARTNVEDMLPEESRKIKVDLELEKQAHEAALKLKEVTLAARKRRACDRLAVHLRALNFIMFWPHCHQAHFDLYEKWDLINIQVAAKDEFLLKAEDIKEILYMSDIDTNEACVYSLLAGEVLVVVFKMSETDTRNFVRLLRYALYEEIPIPKEDAPPEKQVPPIPAFERYATISKTKREVRRERYQAKMEKLRQEKEEADRLAAEQARLAREAEEEREKKEKQRKEEERMARIQAGLPDEPDVPVVEELVEEEINEDVVAEVPIDETEQGEIASVREEEFHSDVSIDGEDYIPPGGFLVPGLYSPPSDMAKANALAFFYPKMVEQLTKVESEYLPPHVLVMFDAMKRNDVSEVMQQFQDEIINIGVFEGDDPYHMEHLAYTIKQYDKIIRLRRHKDRLALMVSRKRSLPLLQLAGLNPCYISADVNAGERDCLALFPVGYGDDYIEAEGSDEGPIAEKFSESKQSANTRSINRVDQEHGEV